MHLQYEKKMKKFDLVRILSHNHEIPLFCEKFTGLEIWEKNSRFSKLILKIGFCVLYSQITITTYIVYLAWYQVPGIDTSLASIVATMNFFGESKFSKKIPK